MLINFQYLFKKYRLKITGILHIGAHELQELSKYSICGVKDITWVEAMDDKVNQMKLKFPTQKIINAVVSDKDNEEIIFNVSNNEESSSILKFGTHTQEHPHVKFVEHRNYKTITLKKLVDEEKINIDNINFLNLDIQGAELKALRGLGDYLKKIDYIYSEVNEKELYIGCDLIGSLDQYLEEFGFRRVETSMTKHGWGDAFYIKN